MRRLVITGATGMLGTALARFALRQGVNVLALCNPQSVRLKNLLYHSGISQEQIFVCNADSANFESCSQESSAQEGDIQESGVPCLTILSCGIDGYVDLAKKAAKLPKCDVFVHFAWQGTYGKSRDDKQLQDQNILYANQAAKLAHALGCECFIGVGSQAECGPLCDPFSGDSICKPLTSYGQTKLEACAQTKACAQALGMRHIWARVGSAYGPGDNMRTCMMQAIAHACAEEPFLCTPGEQQWDYIHCDDAAKAFYSMALDGVDGRIYSVGSGKTRQLKEYISLACAAANPSFVPSVAALEYPPNQTMFLCADISQLKADTGFEPSIEFEEGISSVVRWYHEITLSS